MPGRSGQPVLPHVVLVPKNGYVPVMVHSMMAGHVMDQETKTETAVWAVVQWMVNGSSGPLGHPVVCHVEVVGRGNVPGNALALLMVAVAVKEMLKLLKIVLLSSVQLMECFSHGVSGLPAHIHVRMEPNHEVASV